MEEKLYLNPIGLTNQFRFCGNCFRLDTYRGCSNGCKYCFLHNANEKNNRVIGLNNINPFPADIKIIQNLFKNAFETDREYKNINIELLRHKVPLHLGGLSDPFQECEKEYEITKEVLKLSNKYSYPIILSTKGKYIDDEHFNLLNKDIHAIQISLFSDNQKSIEKFEKNTPSVNDRIELIKKFKNLGFWVSLRIQPLIYIDEAISLIKKVENYIDFITIEHLKLPADNTEKREFLLNLLSDDIRPFYKRRGREYELEKQIKLKNINKIKENCKIKIGIGDNDLMLLSDTNNCCGIDTINKNFDNWLKYNKITIEKTKCRNYWCPSCKLTNIYPYITKTGSFYKECVDYYIKNINKEHQVVNQMSLF